MHREFTNAKGLVKVQGKVEFKDQVPVHQPFQVAFYVPRAETKILIVSAFYGRKREVLKKSFSFPLFMYRENVLKTHNDPGSKPCVRQ